MLHPVLSFIDTMAFSQVNYESLYLRKFSTFSNQSSVSQVKYNRLCTPVLYCTVSQVSNKTQMSEMVISEGEEEERVDTETKSV